MLFSLPPLLLSVKELALNAANRLGRPKMSWTGSGSKVEETGHLKSFMMNLKKIEEIYYPQDDIPPKQNWLENRKVVLLDVKKNYRRL